jgi:hypothetical protein
MIEPGGWYLIKQLETWPRLARSSHFDKISGASIVNSPIPNPKRTNVWNETQSD